MKETMYGRELEFDESIPEGVIKMHPQTWAAIRPIHRRNEVSVTVKNQKKVD